MPELVNTNPHPVRATADGREVRLVPGQVMSVDGALADVLSSYEGVESANNEHREAWEAESARRSGNVTTADAGKGSLDRMTVEMRAAARHAAVAVPLNQVIGDDDAPLGPPSGTITTKQAASRVDEEHNKAFGNREAMPEDQEKNLSAVQRLQAEAAARTEELHNSVLEQAAEDGNESATTDTPTSTNSAEDEKPKSRKKKGQSANEGGSDANPA